MTSEGGRTVLVVGGTGGIGAATALRPVIDGATVIAAGLGKTALPAAENPPCRATATKLTIQSIRKPYAADRSMESR